MGMKRFLITTALEETWLDDQPVLFLGEWCRLYSRKEHWSKMNAEVSPYHWDDRGKFYSDYQYLGVLYERALVDLAIQLNQIHGVGHNQRYWRILVGPWLAYFIQILFDRWLSIQEAINRYEITGTIILSGNENEFVPNDMAHMIDLVLNDKWNHHIYANILERFGTVPSIRRDSHSQSVALRKSKSSIKHRVMTILAKVASCFVRKRDAFLINTSLPLFSEIRLYLEFLQIPQWWKTPEPVYVPVELQQRKWDMVNQGRTEFEKFVFGMIPKQIPTLYLEGYQHLAEQIRNLSWPSRPKVIYTSNVLFHDTVSMAYTAEKVEQGTPLVYGQHGGFYGMAWFMWAEDHERKIADKYLTWGWTEEGGAETVPVGITKKIKYRNNSSSKTATDLLLILSTLPRYTFRLDSDAGANQISEYIFDCLQFGHSIRTSSAYSALVVRPHRAEYGWGEKARWASDHPKVRLDDGSKPIWDLVENSRLIVYTYNSTGYLEFFAAGVPTIIFWDMKTKPVRDSAIPYFEDLKRVGIFHETPESAAAHVNMIWGDVDAWWTNLEVQEVLARFKKQYCYHPDNLLDRVEAVLRNVIDESENKKSLANPARKNLQT